MDISDCPFYNMLDIKLARALFYSENGLSDMNDWDDDIDFKTPMSLYRWLVSNKPMEDIIELSTMKDLLSNEIYSFISQSDKEFIMAFNNAMINAGYENNDIQPYVVFGKYKIEYYKPGTKSKKYIARIYLRDDEIVLRLYFSNIDKHKNFIEKSPDFLKTPFIDDSHQCKPNCKGMTANNKCRYRKTYTLNGITYVKCAEQSFMFYHMNPENVSMYVKLLATFYPIRKDV